jgi:hypothetical protein
VALLGPLREQEHTLMTAERRQNQKQMPAVKGLGIGEHLRSLKVKMDSFRIAIR